MSAIVIVILRFFAAILGVPIAIFGLIAAYNKYIVWKRKKILQDDLQAQTFLSQFNRKEIEDAISGYVSPHCSPVDPSNKDDHEFLADTRENVFEYFDRVIATSGKAFHLLLADTGMGKTSLCINYFVHRKAKFPENMPCIISLASGDADRRIRAVRGKSNSILILDAFDEDPAAILDAKGRLMSILKLSADFKFVLITCRSQFFVSEDSIPYETPLPVLVPRGIGSNSTFSLIRSYISPFDGAEIDKYISKHFPIWNPFRIKVRKRAKSLISEIPDLAYRPMLLERLPEIAKDKYSSTELYDLYDNMIDGWLNRESRWIKIKDLRSVSYELAIYISAGMPNNNGRIDYDEIEKLAVTALGKNPSWKHLTSRSLLNRDSQGRFKFAHKSILEFLIVKLAIQNDNRASNYQWTPFMKELLISWGHTTEGKRKPEIAHGILSSESGRRNIAPLLDMWASPASVGFPDFKKIAQRKHAYSGARLAPVAWRRSNVEIRESKNIDGVIRISDHEYNLEWELIDSKIFEQGGIPEKILDVLNIQSNTNKVLPSYDQIVSLIEALYHSGQNVLLKNGDKFLLSDRPSASEYCVAVVGDLRFESKSLRCIDRDRKISGTDRKISTYVTGSGVSANYATNVKVRQLWLIAK